MAAAGLVIAYEPVWAIGTGLSATPADVAAMAQIVRRGVVANGWTPQAAADLPVLYGGSVTSANAAELFAEPSLDGALVGGASLLPDEMAVIVARAGVIATARRSADETDRSAVTSTVQRPRPIVLIVLDGFGIGRDPVGRRDRRGQDAGLARPAGGVAARGPGRLGGGGRPAAGPDGQLEVGHLNLGAGRPVLPDLQRIDTSLYDGTFDRTPALLDACRRAARPGGRLHLISLVGPGGVHANDRHLVAIAASPSATVSRSRVHALLDGRDTPPRSAAALVPDLERRLAAGASGARIATVGGRYFGMDRDHRWDRTAAAYDAIVHGVGRARPPPKTRSPCLRSRRDRRVSCSPRSSTGWPAA